MDGRFHHDARNDDQDESVLSSGAKPVNPAHGARAGAGLASRVDLLDAALDAIGRAAYVLAPDGAVLCANRLGDGRLAAEGMLLRAELAASVAVDAVLDVTRWSVTRVRGASDVDAYLLVAAASPTSEHVRAARAAERWGLTRREQQVLELLLDGATNRTIATMLGISLRTAELHVSALFEKSHSESRTQVIAEAHRL